MSPNSWSYCVLWLHLWISHEFPCIYAMNVCGLKLDVMSLKIISFMYKLLILFCTNSSASVFHSTLRLWEKFRLMRAALVHICFVSSAFLCCGSSFGGREAGRAEWSSIGTCPVVDSPGCPSDPVHPWVSCKGGSRIWLVEGLLVIMEETELT